MATCEPTKPVEYILTLTPEEARNLCLTLGPILAPRHGIAGIYDTLIQAGAAR